MVGDRIFPKCQTAKYAVSQGKRAMKRGGRFGGKSEYSLQLTEKQKMRFTYGLNERQFSRLVHEAHDNGGQNASTTLYQNLERRIDNIIFRLGIALSRAHARQMVSHGHVLVNGKRVSIPSYRVRMGDGVSVHAGSRTPVLLGALKERLVNQQLPEWLSLDTESLEARVRALPRLAETAVAFNIPAVLEFYSRA